MVDHMLTTVDNPFSPFTQFEQWLRWDTQAGYHTLGLLARITFDSDYLSDADESLAIELGIEEVVRENVSGMHRSVTADYKPVVSAA